MAGSDYQRMQARLEAQAAQFRAMRARLSPEQVDRMLFLLDRQAERIRRTYRRGDEGGLPVPVEPPRGPLPLQGGAEAVID